MHRKAVPVVWTVFQYKPGLLITVCPLRRLLRALQLNAHARITAYKSILVRIVKDLIEADVMLSHCLIGEAMLLLHLFKVKLDIVLADI